MRVLKVSLAMPETNLNPEQAVLKKTAPKKDKAKLVPKQKPVALNTRIQLLEKENAEFSRLLKMEKQINLKRTRLLSTASHDCRSPLTSIQLSADLIERYYDRLDQQKLFAHLNKIKLSVIALTDQLNALVEI